MNSFIRSFVCLFVCLFVGGKDLVELFLEGTRYIDMLRWKDESLVHDVYGYNRTKLSDPSSPATWQFEKVTVATRKFDPAKGWLWPIPLTDMQNNDQLTQNPGY